MEEGAPKRTIYNVIQRYEESGQVEYKKLCGRPSVKTSPKKVEKVRKLYEKAPSTSIRIAARKLKMTVSTLSNIKLKKLGITARTKKKGSKYTENQEARAKTGCRKVYEKTLKKVLVIDDETYVTFDPNQVPGRDFVHSADHSQLNYDQKFKQIVKFPKRYLVWQAMDELGNVSDAFISTGTMTGQIYLEECLKKRLIPFILKYHEIEDIIFWPDLATCHYAGVVTSFLAAKNIDFVSKKENPPNVPEARGIEKFWAECKRRYHHRSEEPKNLRGFKQVWSRLSLETGKTCGKAIMDHAYKVLRKIGFRGVRQALTDISNKS